MDRKQECRPRTLNLDLRVYEELIGEHFAFISPREIQVKMCAGYCVPELKPVTNSTGYVTRKFGVGRCITTDYSEEPVTFTLAADDRRDGIRGVWMKRIDKSCSCGPRP